MSHPPIPPGCEWIFQVREKFSARLPIPAIIPPIPLDEPGSWRPWIAARAEKACRDRFEEIIAYWRNRERTVDPELSKETPTQWMEAAEAWREWGNQTIANRV